MIQKKKSCTVKSPRKKLSKQFFSKASCPPRWGESPNCMLIDSYVATILFKAFSFKSRSRKCEATVPEVTLQDLRTLSLQAISAGEKDLIPYQVVSFYISHIRRAVGFITCCQVFPSPLYFHSMRAHSGHSTTLGHVSITPLFLECQDLQSWDFPAAAGKRAHFPQHVKNLPHCVTDTYYCNY